MNKYQRRVPSTTIDVYDVLNAYQVDSHAVGHAIKKLLMAGQRGHKDRLQDLREAVQAIEREIDISGRVEQENPATGDSGGPVDYIDGEWHEWHGGECPVGHVDVQYVTRCGYKLSRRAEHLEWDHSDHPGDIIRFRVIK